MCLPANRERQTVSKPNWTRCWRCCCCVVIVCCTSNTLHAPQYVNTGDSRPEVEMSRERVWSSEIKYSMPNRPWHRILNFAGSYPVTWYFYILSSPRPRTHILTGRQHLRSARRQLMDVPRHRRTTFGRRAFSVTGPTVWNSLSNTLREQSDEDSFKRQLKTFLFSRTLGLAYPAH